MAKNHDTPGPGIESAPRRYKDILDRALVRDTRLSYRALGVAVRLLSNVQGYKMTSLDLAQERPNAEGRDAIRTALGELEAAGYLTRDRVRLCSGQVMTKVVITDQPPAPENPASVSAPKKPTPEKPAPGSPRVGESGSKSSNGSSSKCTTTTTPALTFPSQISGEQQVVVVKVISGLDQSVQQQLLDELAGALCSSNPPRRPVAWLRSIALKARSGGYVQDLALTVAAARQRQMAAVEAERQRRQATAEADERRCDPLKRERDREHIAAIRRELEGQSHMEDTSWAQQ